MRSRDKLDFVDLQVRLITEMGEYWDCLSLDTKSIRELTNTISVIGKFTWPRVLVIAWGSLKTYEQAAFVKKARFLFLTKTDEVLKIVQEHNENFRDTMKSNVLEVLKDKNFKELDTIAVFRRLKMIAKDRKVKTIFGMNYERNVPLKGKGIGIRKGRRGFAHD